MKRKLRGATADRFGISPIADRCTYGDCGRRFRLERNSSIWSSLDDFPATSKTMAISSVSHGIHQRPAELYRTTTLAVEALRTLGVAEPRRHIAVVRIMRPYTNSSIEGPEGVGTILVSRRPFTDAELDTIEAEASRLDFEVPLSPRSTLDPTFERLTNPNGLDEFLASYPINITAPTDNSPFFFNMLRLRDILQPSLLDLGNLSFNMKAVATSACLLIVTVLTALHSSAVVVDARSSPLRRRPALHALFIAIGLDSC